MNQPQKPPRKRNAMLYLIVGIPGAAVLMGAVSLFFALSQPDPGVRQDGVPLSKTSWQAQP